MNRIRGTFVKTAAVAALSLVLLAGAARAEDKIYTLATASLGGAYYICGTGVAEAVTKAIPGMTVNSVISQGSSGNPLLVNSGEVELAITNYYSGFNAVNGRAPYEEQMPIAGICTLQYSIIHFTTFASRDDIKTLADLKGKNVAIGPAGGGGALLYKEILPFWGITMEDTNFSFLSYAEGSDAVNDRKIDVNVPHGAPPMEAVSSLASFTPTKILSLETDKMQEALKKYPYYDIATIHAGTYKGIDEDVQSFGVQDIVICREDMDEEEVYQITKAIHESIDFLKTVHPSLVDMKMDGYKHSLVPLHPGAKRYYEEKGIAIN